MAASLNLQKYLLFATLLAIYCSVANACHGQLLVSGITEADKRVILQEHNRLRQVVATGRYPGQPGAQNMREIVWDDELAARAQKWADNCQFRHDPFRTINRFTMGQNLAIIWSTVPLDANDGDFPSRIQSWFNEVQKYSFGDAWSPATGHYSQLVWGETSLVGCGFSEYKDATKYNKLYVCNYGPGGNVVGYNPYQVGKPACGTYGMRPSSHYQGLCSAPGAPVAAINTNTIETYEYKPINAFNNKQTAYAQPATSTSTSSYSSSSHSSYPKQASSLPKATTSNGGVSSTSTGYKTYQTSVYKYKTNKLEAYKPSPAEFQKSVRKHTILRNYVENAAGQQEEQNQQQQQQNEQQEPEIYIIEASQRNEQKQTTPKPVTPKRGWSLLTWRG